MPVDGSVNSSVRSGHPNDEFRALPHRTGDADVAAVDLGHMSYDRKTEPRAARFAVAGDVDAVKALEHPPQIARRNADAGVGNGEHRRIAVTLEQDVDPSSGRRVPDGVAKEVVDHLREVGRAPDDV